MPDITWQKSSFSSGDVNQNCLEVAKIEDSPILHIRESECPDVVLTGTPSSFCGLIDQIKTASLD